MENAFRCRQCGFLPGGSDTDVCGTCGNCDWQLVVVDPVNPPAPDEPVVLP